MECKFVVGQKVVCINDQPRRPTAEKLLTIGNIYTVSGFDIDLVDQIFITLMETDGKGYWSISNPAWFPHRFKPLEETKTDISIFTKLLRPTKTKAPVKVSERV